MPRADRQNIGDKRGGHLRSARKKHGNTPVLQAFLKQAGCRNIRRTDLCVLCICSKRQLHSLASIFRRAKKAQESFWIARIFDAAEAAAFREGVPAFKWANYKAPKKSTKKSTLQNNRSVDFIFV